MFVTIDDLELFDVVDCKIGCPPYVVVRIIETVDEFHQANRTVTLANNIDSYEETTGLFGLIERKMAIRYFSHLGGKTHATIANQTICGTRSTMNSIQVDGNATCKKCLELINKQEKQ